MNCAFLILLLTLSSTFAANTYQVSIFDLGTNFTAGLNGATVKVGDSVAIACSGAHNAIQISSLSCSAPFVSGGFSCCDAVSNPACACNTATYTFNATGTYFFKCAWPTHCSPSSSGGLNMLGAVNVQPGGAETLLEFRSIQLLVSCLLIVLFYKH